jgi:sugar lactone lactonase YvrE
MRTAMIALSSLAVALLAGCAADATRVAAKSAPHTVEVVAYVPTMPGNIAVSRDNRIFLSQHPFGNPTYRVMELLPDGTQKPFPTPAWSGAPNAEGVGIAAIIGIEVDQRNRLWMVDAGGPTPPKLIAWDLSRDALAYNISLASAAVAESFMQDLAIDTKRDHVYLADIGGIDPQAPQKPAIVVVDLKTGTARRVLEGHSALRAEDVDMIVEGQPVQVKRGDEGVFRPRAGINPITIDAGNEYVYFGSMNGTTIWRVPAKKLADASSTDLAASVERWGSKGVSDGINIDRRGNVYVTDLNTSSIGVALAGEKKSGGYVTLTDAAGVLSWPDGVSFGGDGYLYIAVNQLHRSSTLNAGVDATKPPFIIARVKPLGPALLGR